VTGLIITHDPPTETRPHVLFAGRIAACQQPGCRPGQRFLNLQDPGSWDGPDAERLEIFPGRYRLYVLADGAPVTVKLKLNGLKGRTDLRAKRPASIDLTPPVTHHQVSGGVTSFSGGNSYERGAMGMALVVLFVQAPEGTRVAKGVCQYGHVQPPPELPSGAYCGALSSQWNLGVPEVDDDGYIFFFLYKYGWPTADETPDALHLAAWVTSPTPLDEVATQMFSTPLLP
jgi:hypothetical protein